MPRADRYCPRFFAGGRKQGLPRRFAEKGCVPMASRPKDSEPIVPVCAAIIVKGDRVLVGRRKEGSPEGGKWEFPGGKPMAGEDLRACLRRELDEELGVIAEIGDLYDVVNHRYEQRNVLLILFRADISEVAIRSGEHDVGGSRRAKNARFPRCGPSHSAAADQGAW